MQGWDVEKNNLDRELKIRVFVLLLNFFTLQLRNFEITNIRATKIL